ncbi:hypothetical protein [Ancylobacter lacus]|uniref:hypothetical protein n=1 Tax=Ancylobacter lacus TaxID=2579970 RepID=UPI001BCBE5FC|nr:hypothetical protein [Ancylobacter lacus]MBS7540734.1 hypothetical protein [Ancylobacter lacus]
MGVLLLRGRRRLPSRNHGFGVALYQQDQGRTTGKDRIMPAILMWLIGIPIPIIIILYLLT